MFQSDLKIKAGSLNNAKVRALIAHHFDSARAATDEASAHALDADGLRSDNINFWSIWRGNDLVGIGALQTLSPVHGEVKSMHTVESARGTGVADAMLCHIMDHARRIGLRRLSLETGSMAFFAPARALYRKHGFVECGPFADYKADPNSAYMTLELIAADSPCA